MAKAHEVTFGEMRFAKKGDAKAYLKAMLARYKLGDQIAEDDEQVLRAALNLHPEAAMKIGSGVRHFEVHSADYGTRCFWVRRIDDSLERFSYQSCM